MIHLSSASLSYVDNIAVFGRDRAGVDQAMHKIISELNACGLLTHDHTPASSQCELLGMHIDGERREIRMTAKRHWRVKWALEWILRKRRVLGKTRKESLVIPRLLVCSTETHSVSLMQYTNSSENIMNRLQLCGTQYVVRLKLC